MTFLLSLLSFGVLNQKTPPNHLTQKNSQSPCGLLRSFPAFLVPLQTRNITKLHSFQTGSYSSTIYSILKPACSSPSNSRTLSTSYISLLQQNLKNLREELRGQKRYTNCRIHQTAKSQSNHSILGDLVVQPVSFKESATAFMSSLFQSQEMLHSSWMEVS